MSRNIILTSLFTMLYVAVTAPGQTAVAPGFTQPSERRTQAFESPGIVAEVLVKEGDKVKAGQTLMRLESRMDQSELEVRRIDAESTVEIEAAEKEHDLRQVQYERRRDNPSGYSAQEIEEAKITMELAALKIQEARQKKAQAQAVYARQGVKVELMDINSQVDGVVEKINVDAGEMADPQKPEGAISVVKNDPLWVEIPLLKAWQVAKLSPGQQMEVRYTMDPADAWQKGKIIYIAPVADARSGTQSVRLEMPNPDGRAAGLDVEVKLPAELMQEPKVERTAASN